MKIKLVLILLLISSYTFAQNWSQVGAVQFTDTSTDAAISFDNSGVPYVAYIKTNASNKPYVKKFDGTNWVDIASPEVSTVGAVNIAIKLNPITNEFWLAYRRIDNSRLDVFRYNGTNWIQEGNQRGTGSLSNYRLQIQFNATGNVRVAGRLTNKKLRVFTYNTSIAGNWSTADEVLQATTGNNDQRFDFTSYSSYYRSVENYYTQYSGNAGKKNMGSTANAYIFNTSWSTSYRFDNIAGINDENYLAVINHEGVDYVKIFANSTSIKDFPISNNDNSHVIAFRKNILDDKLYLMFEDISNNLRLEKYDIVGNSWETLPSIGIAMSGVSFNPKMEINTIDGGTYVLYLDGTKMSVKKYVPLITPRIYVDIDATGANDGASWADAYTNLETTLANLNGSETEIWVAAGIYTPDASDRTKSFTISRSNLTLYGGFSGTETSLANRDMSLIHTTNETILSGDLSGDDTIVSYNHSSRSENSYRVVQINGNDIIIDGLSIANGHADATTGEGRYGAGLETDDSVANFTIKNSIIKNNVAWWGAGLMFTPNLTGIYTIEACIVDNNLANYGAGFDMQPRINTSTVIDVSNSLFKNNKTDDGGFLGAGGAAGMIRSYYSGTQVDSNIINNTFVNNYNYGSDTNSDFPTIALSKNSGTIYTVAANNIFWKNKGGVTGSTTIAKAFGSAKNAFAESSLNVYNSIDEDNFSSASNLVNISNSDPLFTDYVNNDFTLQIPSPAKDTGDNSKILSGISTDLVGTNRIINTTVDMGCYERVIVQYTLLTNVVGTGTINIGASTVHNSGTVLSITATPATGWSFDGWSGASTSVAATISITMGANKSLVANFSQIQYELTLVATNGSSLPDSGSLVGGVYIYNSGTGVIITPTGDTGYSFVRFDITDSSGTVTSSISNPLSITMTDHMYVETVFATTASVENNVFVSLKIFPNPVMDILKIELNEEISQIEIYNMLGQKVVISELKNINVSDLKMGTYLIKINTFSKKAITKLFVKK
jgi:uncharacterized repeat protein (TIGR02543 family)